MLSVSRGLTALGVVAALAAAGCGSSKGNGSSAAKGGGGASLASVRSTVATLLGPKGTYVGPPKTAPRPASGKRIVLISCGQSSPACSTPMAGAAAAAQALGWQTTLVDSKGDVNAAGAGIRRAVAEKADGIFIYYIDCQYLKAPLEVAKQAGIPVVAAESVDCNVSNPGAPSLFTSTVTYAGGDDYLTWVRKWWNAQVDYAIAKTGGTGNMMMFTDDTQLGSKAIAQSGAAEARKCSGCSFQVKLVPFADIGTKLQGEVQQDLLQNPNVNVVLSGYEAVVVGGVEAGVRALGRKALMNVGEGGAPGMALVKAGRAQFGAGIPLGWEGYAGIDALVRLMAKQKPVDSGIGVQLFDKDHNMPSGDRYEPPFDYAALYKKAWGVG